MFSDNILKLINNSVFYNHTISLTNAFLTLPLTSSLNGDFIRCNRLNQFVFIVVVLLFFFFFFSCASAVKIAADDNNYNQEKLKKKKSLFQHNTSHVFL